MKINFLTLAFCLCMVSAALVHVAFAQIDRPFTASPFADYDLLSQYAAQEQPSRLGVVSDQQPTNQPLAKSWTGQATTATSGPGGSSPDGVNGIFLYLEGVPGGSTVESHKD